MADILDAAQTNTPASPVGGQPPADTTPVEPPPPPPPAVEPPAPSTDSLIVPPPAEPPVPEPISSSPAPPPPVEPPPVEKPKKKSHLGVLLAGLLLLVIALPILWVAVQRQVEIRSRAAGSCLEPCSTDADCAATEYCYKPAPPACPVCKPRGTTCTPGVKRCSGNYAETCNTQGTAWLSQDCGSAGCNLGTLACNPATPDLSPKCVNSTTLETWNGSAWVTQTCDYGCSNGACNAAPPSTTAPSPTNIPGTICNTAQGWPGTCTFPSECKSGLDAGVAWDIMAPCINGRGCCGTSPIVGASCSNAESWPGTCTRVDKCNTGTNVRWDRANSPCNQLDLYGCCGTNITLCSGGSTRPGTNASACLAGETYAGPSQMSGYVCCMPNPTLCSGGNTRPGTNASACLAGETYAGPSQMSGYVCCMPSTTYSCSGCSANYDYTYANWKQTMVCSAGKDPIAGTSTYNCNCACGANTASHGVYDSCTANCTVPTTPGVCSSPYTCVPNRTACTDAYGTVKSGTCSGTSICCDLPVVPPTTAPNTPAPNFSTCPSGWSVFGACDSNYVGKGCICTSSKNGVTYECKRNTSGGPAYEWAPCGGTSNCPWPLTNSLCCPTGSDACATLGDRICVGDPFISVCSSWDLSCPSGHQYYWKHLENVTSCANITPTTTPPPTYTCDGCSSNYDYTHASWQQTMACSAGKNPIDGTISYACQCSCGANSQLHQTYGNCTTQCAPSSPTITVTPPTTYTCSDCSANYNYTWSTWLQTIPCASGKNPIAETVTYSKQCTCGVKPGRTDYIDKNGNNYTTLCTNTPPTTPTTPVTPTTAPQCIAIVAYDQSGNALSQADLAKLQPGYTITLAFAPGGAATKVCFSVNGAVCDPLVNETSNKNSNGQFIWNYTLANVTNFTIVTTWFDGKVWH